MPLAWLGLALPVVWMLMKRSANPQGSKVRRRLSHITASIRRFQPVVCLAGPSLPSTQHKISLESPRQSTVRLRQAMFGSSNHAILKNFRATVAAGMSKLLHTLRIWKKRRNEYLDLHKEKSEVSGRCPGPFVCLSSNAPLAACDDYERAP